MAEARSDERHVWGSACQARAPDTAATTGGVSDTAFETLSWPAGLLAYCILVQIWKLQPARLAYTALDYDYPVRVLIVT